MTTVASLPSLRSRRSFCEGGCVGAEPGQLLSRAGGLPRSLASRTQSGAERRMMPPKSRLSFSRFIPMRQLAKAILALIFSLVAGCDRGSGSPPVSSTALVGTWQLQSVADKSPDTISIQKYEAEFLGDGTWEYRATMAGRFAGTEMKGSGTWKLDGEFMQYSAGANTGRTRVAIVGNVLTLSPDPVVTPGGKTKSTTRYERAKRE